MYASNEGDMVCVCVCVCAIHVMHGSGWGMGGGPVCVVHFYQVLYRDQRVGVCVNVPF